MLKFFRKLFGLNKNTQASKNQTKNNIVNTNKQYNTNNGNKLSDINWNLSSNENNKRYIIEDVSQSDADELYKLRTFHNTFNYPFDNNSSNDNSGDNSSNHYNHSNHSNDSYNHSSHDSGSSYHSSDSSSSYDSGSYSSDSSSSDSGSYSSSD